MKIRILDENVVLKVVLNKNKHVTLKIIIRISET